MSEENLLPWELYGCQVVSKTARLFLTCPHREAIHQCEVIGPHERHQWSLHTIAHERAGNGYSCGAIGDGREILDRFMAGKLVPVTVVGVWR